MGHYQEHREKLMDYGFLKHHDESFHVKGRIIEGTFLHDLEVDDDGGGGGSVTGHPIKTITLRRILKFLF